MATFMARIALTYPFAQEHLKEIGGFWERLTERLPEEQGAELLIYRFTFATYKLEAQTREACREILQSAWKEAFPEEEDGIAEILITGFEADEAITDLMRAIYNNYYGAEDYLRLATELRDAIPYLREKEALDVLIWQNYLVAMDEGCGFTTFLASFGDYLKKMNVYAEEEIKRVRYLEYCLGKETENGYTSADDLYDQLLEATGEDNEYGIVGIDVCFYLEGKKYDDLRAFLKRLHVMQSEYIFAFRIPYLEKKAFDEIRKIFADLMLIRPLQTPPPSDPVLMENIWNLLHDKKLYPDASIMDLVEDKIHQEKMDGRFYGFRTADQIAREIILTKTTDYMDRLGRGEEADDDAIVADNIGSILSGEQEKVTGYAALEELIGMEEITAKVREIIAQVKVAISNDKLDRPCIHMRFTGSPGTGKTTVARIIGQIMREEGILRKGGFFEYSGRDLVAEYVGQTAVKTASICRDSYGSVLFIDEAYALCEGDIRNDFGKEAITTLISEMENHRDDMLVVMAGYTDEMEELMKLNPGIRSRMPRILHFPNYTKDQLFAIFMLMVKKHFTHTSELEEEAKQFFQALSPAYMESKEFANARFVRNLYERTWSKAALRASLNGTRELQLTKEDFIAASSEKEFGEKIEHRKVLGF